MDCTLNNELYACARPDRDLPRLVIQVLTTARCRFTTKSFDGQVLKAAHTESADCIADALSARASNTWSGVKRRSIDQQRECRDDHLVARAPALGQPR